MMMPMSLVAALTVDEEGFWEILFGGQNPCSALSGLNPVHHCRSTPLGKYIRSLC
jgi:hypothetical protein